MDNLCWKWHWWTTICIILSLIPYILAYRSHLFLLKYSLKTRGATYPLDILVVHMQISTNSVIFVKSCAEVWSQYIKWRRLWRQPFSYTCQSAAQKSEYIARWQRPSKRMEEWKCDKMRLEFSIYGLILVVTCQHLWSILLDATYLQVSHQSYFLALKHWMRPI